MPPRAKRGAKKEPAPKPEPDPELSEEEDEEIIPEVPSTSAAPVPMDQESGLGDDDEEDEELPAPTSINTKQSSETVKLETEDDLEDAEGSAEFADAEAVLAVDKWDTSSWIKLISEVEKGNGRKDTTLVATYDSFFKVFPRASMMYIDLIDHYDKKLGDKEAVDSVFARCLEKCRSVALWHKYLDIMRTRTVETVSKYSDDFPKQRKLMEDAFERALTNVGTSLRSASLWHAYIDFVKSWPEVGALDQGNKHTALKGILGRCSLLATDEVDAFWKEFETMEAEETVKELQQSKDRARTVAKDRSALITGKVQLDLLAVRPRNIHSELEHLQSWRDLLHHDFKNPEQMGVEEHRAHMWMVFEQALCPLRFYPEVWIALAQLAGEQSIDDARSVLEEACEAIPDSALLCAALAELEERDGNVDAARTVLTTHVKEQPSAFAFSILQRFVRRVDGREAARTLFSGTLASRKDAQQGRLLGAGIYRTHALTELHSNGEAAVALRVLSLGEELLPAVVHSVEHVRLKAKVLTHLRDVTTMRSLMEMAIGGETAVAEAVEASTRMDFSSGTGAGGEGGGDASDAPNLLSLEDKMALWDEYLHLEGMANEASVVRLSDLQRRRSAFAAAVLDQRKARGATDAELETAAATGSTHRTRVRPLAPYQLMDAAMALLDRHWAPGSGYDTLPLPGTDADMFARCRQDVSLLAQKREEDERRGSGNRDDEASFAGVPPFLRDLLSDLPRVTVQMDVGRFINHLKKMNLPPRPPADGTVSGTKRTRGAGNSGPKDDIFRNRRRKDLSTFT